MKKGYLVIMLLVVFGLSGCAANAEYEPAGDEYYDSVQNGESESPEIDFTVDTNGGDVINSPDNPVLANRKIIYIANLALISTNPDTVYNNIVDMLSTYDGYIESENISNRKYVVTIRVLSANLMDFVEDIKLEGDVLNYSKTSEDITNSYSTFEARLDALETEHQRILDLIELAVDLDDLLILHDKRVEIETELNQIGLQLATYDSLVDYSTINITITKIENISDILDKTTKPSIYVKDQGTKYLTIQVINQSDEDATIYLKVKQNGELIREYDEEVYGGGSYEFEVTELDSNKVYTFEAYSLEKDHTISNMSTTSAKTESTFITRIASTFNASVNSIVTLFEVLGIMITALLPYAVLGTILFFPARILYRKKIKPANERRKMQSMLSWDGEKKDKKV